MEPEINADTCVIHLSDTARRTSVDTSPITVSVLATRVTHKCAREGGEVVLASDLVARGANNLFSILRLLGWLNRGPSSGVPVTLVPVPTFIPTASVASLDARAARNKPKKRVAIIMMNMGKVAVCVCLV